MDRRLQSLVQTWHQDFTSILGAKHDVVLGTMNDNHNESITTIAFRIEE